MFSNLMLPLDRNFDIGSNVSLLFLLLCSYHYKDKQFLKIKFNDWDILELVCIIKGMNKIRTINEVGSITLDVVHHTHMCTSKKWAYNIWFSWAIIYNCI